MASLFRRGRVAGRHLLGGGEFHHLDLADLHDAARVVLLEGEEAGLGELVGVVDVLVQELAVDRDLEVRQDVAAVVLVDDLDLLGEPLAGRNSTVRIGNGSPG